MTLEELLERLKALTYREGRDTYDYPVITQRHFDKVEQLIRQYALDNHDSEMGELKGRLHAYEQIIAKSNFAPMLPKEDQEKRLYCKLYVDYDPVEKAEKMYQTCGDKEELGKVLNALTEYYEGYDE